MIKVTLLHMKGFFIGLGLVAAALLFVGGNAAGIETPSHLDRTKQPQGCAGCHGGSGSFGTPLLKGQMVDFCYKCHGSENRQWANADMESLFSRRSAHPIEETADFHRVGEKLPEESNFQRRHVSCYDCHVVHKSTVSSPWRRAKGYLPGTLRGLGGSGPPPGLRLKAAETEYQLCYLCHSDSANLPATSRNISAEFDPQNRSFHPVESVGKNSRVPSLVPQLSPASRITCGDCHGNSDMGSPRGPHGSDYPPLLLAEYRTEDGIESPKTYELCYMCHDRNDIMSDRSFKRHRLHVQGQGTSCHTCHSSHGSRGEANLISFNGSVVSALMNSGGQLYLPGPDGQARCYLSCHGVDHTSQDVGGKQWPW